MRSFPDLELKEFRVFKKLGTPHKIQDFLDRLPVNFESRGDTCRSPLMALRHKEAHCLEGAMLAAAALWYHGEPPLLLDLKAAPNDDDHVVALFRRRGLWGAISKTNHAVLRYRDPIYRSLRELAMSYFNEYFKDNGQKTLRSHSAPFDLSKFGTAWLTAPDHLFSVSKALDRSPHHKLMPDSAIRILRKADRFERKVTKATEWKKQ